MTPDLVLCALAFVCILYAIWHLPHAAEHVARLARWFEERGR